MKQRLSSHADKLMTVKEVAERLNLSLSKIYRLLSAGRMPHYQIEGSKRISEEQLCEFLDQQAVERGETVAPAPRAKRVKLKHLQA